LERVAEEARVARRTIYQIFGSRLGLFDALEQDLLQRGRFVDIQDAFNTNTDARQILDQMLPASVRLMEREEAVLRALHLQARIDPEAAQLTKRINEGRIGGMRHLAQLLKEQGYTRPDLTQTEVGDILSLVTDFATFDQLRTSLALSTNDILHRLQILVASLLA
jgi:AcrR family transcriptional regulator